MEDSAEENSNITNSVPDPKPKEKKPEKLFLNKKQLIIFSLLAIATIVLVGVGVFLWQQSILSSSKDKLESENKNLQQQVASQSAQISKLEEENDSLTAKVAYLDKTLQEATAAAQFEFGEVSLNSASGDKLDWEGSNLVIVDVVLSNESKQTLFISTTSFKLKDSNNKSYPQAQSGSYNMPAGKVLLFDQQIASGEKVSGSLAFWAPENINIYTLIFENQEKTITLN